MIRTLSLCVIAMFPYHMQQSVSWFASEMQHAACLDKLLIVTIRLLLIVCNHVR